MTNVGQPKRATQNRVIALFQDELDYRYQGDWTHRDGNSNIEEGLLAEWLTWRGYSMAQISAALYKLRTEANNHSRNLFRLRGQRLRGAAIRQHRYAGKVFPQMEGRRAGR